MDTDKYMEVFNKLHSFYILISIHDVQQYPLQELKALAHSLHIQQELDPRLQTINQELIQKSSINVEEKKKKKKEKKVRPELTSDKVKQYQDVFNQINMETPSINDSVSCNYLKEEKWKVTRSLQGIIYDGKHLIKVEVGGEGSKIKSKVGFEISSQSKNSTVSIKTLQTINYTRKVTNEPVELWIEGRRHMFVVVNEGPNYLGLDFLRDQKVILTCNYRFECFKFCLSFTA